MYYLYSIVFVLFLIYIGHKKQPQAVSSRNKYKSSYEQNTNDFDTLPDELIEHVSHHLQLIDTLAFGCTCHRVMLALKKSLSCTKKYTV